MKVSMQEIKTAQTSIKNSKNKIQGQLNSSKSAWKNVSSSSGLSGAVKKAINAEIDNYQIPLLTKYYDTLHYLSGEFDKTIEDFQSTVRETSNSAIIDTDALSNAESKFSDQQTKYEEINAKFEQIYSSISSIVAVSNPSSSGFAKEMANTKKVLTNTKEWMDTFNGRKQNKNIANALSQQKTQLGRLQGVSGLSYSNPKALEVYQDKAFRNDVKKAHKEVTKQEKLQFKEDHPVLAAINGNMTESDLYELNERINGPASLLKTSEKTTGWIKKIYIGSRVKRLSDGTLILKHPKGNRGSIVGLDKFARRGREFTRISANGKLTEAGKSIAKEIDLFDEQSFFKSIKGRVKDVAKTNLKETGKSTTKGFSFGVTGIIEDVKALKNARGAAKAIPVLNLVAGAADIVTGISESEKQARKDGLKGNQITASKIGGVAVDAAKAGATTLAVGAATAVAASFGAPVVFVAVAGIAASMALNCADKKLKVTEKLKSGVNSLVKGASNWFK